MLRNYLTTALRNIARNRLYATINIVGLAVGFAAVILIAIYVRDELGYDQWIPGHERVYRADIILTRSGILYRHFATTGVDLASNLRTQFPEIETTARYSFQRNALRYGEVEGVEKVAWADPQFFNIFRMPVIAGNVETALSAPDSIVLTRKLARKYFGNDTPIGQSLDIDREHPMQVVAVVEDLPSNTNVNADAFASARAPFSNIASAEALPIEKERGHQFLLTFIRLVPGAHISDVEQRLDDFMARYAPDSGGPMKAGLRFIALADAHLTVVDGFTPGTKPAGNPAANTAIVTVAVLTLLGAGINFVNLMTARAARRAAEVGVRKTAGAFRSDLVVQFLGESFLYVVLAFSLALVLAAAFLPSLNVFLERTISLRVWVAPWVLGIVCLVLAGLSLATGGYPALVLSSFRPAAVLKGGATRSPGSGRVRLALVILQFAVLIGLSFSTAVIYRQNLYAVRDGLRLQEEQTLVVQGPAACKDAFVAQVRGLGGVSSAACSWVMPLTDSSSTTTVQLRDGTTPSLRYDVAAPGFFETYGIVPLAGRLFDAARAGDFIVRTDTTPQSNPPVVINETARKLLGFASPREAIGGTFSWKRIIDFKTREGTSQLPSEIIGVVPDFALDSIRRKIDPAFFYADETLYARLSVKLKGEKIPETLAAIDALWTQSPHTQPISRRFVDQYMQDLYRDVARQSQLFTVFAGVALFIACLGLLGLSAFIAETRTKEIGIRKAMGATKSEIVRLLLWQFSKPVLWANLIAWPAAYLLMRRWLEGFAYHVDLAPWMFLAASALALVIAVATVIGHALLVARAKPVTALRYE